MEEIKFDNNNLQIFARLRGLREIEISQGCTKSIQILDSQSLKLDTDKYTFNKVFSDDLNQKQFYEQSLKDIIKECIANNKNLQFFCYGYSATGKRYTIEGEEQVKDQWGIIPQCINDIFQLTEKEKRISFACIYDDEILDLLSAQKKKLNTFDAKEKQYFEIDGIEKVQAQSAEEMIKLFWKGVKNKFNEHYVMSKNVYYMATIVELYYGDIKFQFVNPGSIESLLDCGYSKEIQKLVAQIQKQLLSLKNVLEDLAEKKQFIRWRGSNLTKILKFGFASKNCKQIMLLNLANCDKELNQNKKCLDLAKQLYNQIGKIKGSTDIDQQQEEQIIIEEEN